MIAELRVQVQKKLVDMHVPQAANLASRAKTCFRTRVKCLRVRILSKTKILGGHVGKILIRLDSAGTTSQMIQ